jgi:large subunit ribosomal protein L13
VDALSYKTEFANDQTVVKKWLVIDATDLVVGRMSSQIARLLLGKHKPDFTPNVDCGDNVIVINADKIRFTGKKWTDKIYIRYTGYPGGQRFETPRKLKERKGASFIIEHAVRGMLPKNKLARKIFHNLYIYNGPTHPHDAQQPTAYTLKLI